MKFMDRLFREPRRQKEADELYRWRTTHALYSRWLAEFPDIAHVLANLEAEAKGSSLSASTPALGNGPWDVGGLRAVIRNLRIKATLSTELRGAP